MSEARRQEEGRLPTGLGLELLAAVAVQTGLVFLLVRIDERVSLAGTLHALVGLVFIVVPVVVLDRRGRPYGRYGLVLRARALPKDLLWALRAAAVFFAPLVFLSPLFWERCMGATLQPFSFAWPEGYPEVALSHLAVVALPEEFFYRGYLMGRLDDIFRGRIGLLGARVGGGLLIQAALFALGHFLMDLNPSRLAVFFPALAFGWLRARTGGIAAPVLFHAASNVFMGFLTTGYGFR